MAYKANTSDLTFITNESGLNLLQRFNSLIKDTRYFDCLVGYFYTSGFYRLYRSLELTEKIRILVGIGVNPEGFRLLEYAGSETALSHAEIKQIMPEYIITEFNNSDDNFQVEEGVNKFIEWLRSGKMQIKAYPSQRLHAKVYIMTFADDDRDAGRVITGSSNFTQSGLADNLEFNVELKNRSDYEFAKNKFEELWENAVDISEKYIQTIEQNTWLNPNITPYELYLKFLYEYFKDELNRSDEIFAKYLPKNFKKFEYQEQAVLNAKKILEEYGGVFISDVVGLGKTYISTMLAAQLEGRTLVIAPPVLLEKANPGSWTNVFSDFRVPADFESLGKLDEIISTGIEKYSNVIIDEAHRFRNETTASYEKLATICRGKRVILVTATPYNNSPRDIISLIKLFQNTKKSTIPGMPNLEKFFNGLDKRLQQYDRKNNKDEYIATVHENAREIRDKVLKYLMVRRTRSEIEKYFSDDLKKQNLKFPNVEKPVPLFYEFNQEEDSIFNKTIELITTKFTYARYTPMLYYTGKVNPLEIQAQRNMGRFMKILLVKRLESSFYAFRKSVDRFIHSYELFLNEYNNGSVYVSKKYSDKIFELLENDDDEAIQKLIDEDKAKRYDSSEFNENFKAELEKDLNILKDIKKQWEKINRDPKLLKFIDILQNNPILKENHLVIFTESKETAEYLHKNSNEQFGKTLLFTGSTGASIRDEVVDNFDARAVHKKDDYRILIATEVLSEGVNLHRSNVIINYDIPWNPTRMMQRIGRINRVDTPFDTIHTFNFFPSIQGNNQLKLKEAAERKIHAFLTLLGGDAETLTEGEPIGSHELFDKLTSKAFLEGNDEAEVSELKYLNIIKDIRDKNPELFEKIKHLPKKARSAKVTQASQPIVTQASQPIVTQASQPIVTQASQPETVTHASQPIVTHASQPIVTHASQPETVTHASQPEIVIQASQPEIVKCRLYNPDSIMYFDPNAPIEKKQRNLPHWQQENTAYFVTFRLYDSIPKQIAEDICRERERWLKANKISSPDEVKKLNQPKRIEYYRLFSKRYDELLDNGYGCCVLAKPQCKKIVEEALKKFNGDRYDLDKYVVMPNHVHVIVIPKKSWKLSKILHSWKSYSANEINKILGREGQLWMAESFDHIIRSPIQLERIRKYIEDNPKVIQPSSPEIEHTQIIQKQDACVTYFRRGKLQKFFVANSQNPTAQEIDFITAATLLESKEQEPRKSLPREVYNLLDKNKEAFIIATTEEMAEPVKSRGQDNSLRLLKILKANQKNTQQLTDEQEQYLQNVIHKLENGSLPRQTVKRTLEKVNQLSGDDIQNPIKVLALLQTHISSRLLEEHYAETSSTSTGTREVILSLYLKDLNK